MKPSSIVLLSAGLDSSVNLFLAHRSHHIKLALTFDYGQRAAKQEISHSRKLCEILNVPHKVIELPFFKEFAHSSLVNVSLEVPVGEEIKIADQVASKNSALKVWVPNRNGIFLNIAAGFAEGLGAKLIVPGFNIEEAETFPDNSEDFIGSINQSLSFSTANAVMVDCFTKRMNKTEIVAEAVKLKIPLEIIWPCYLSLDKPCGSCESCQRLKRALSQNGLSNLFTSLFLTQTTREKGKE